jgi:hypothetical protein
MSLTKSHPPKTLPWTDKFCHFVRFGKAEGQGVRAEGKKDSDMYLPEVAIPSLSPQPLALSHGLALPRRIVAGLLFHNRIPIVSEPWSAVARHRFGSNRQTPHVTTRQLCHRADACAVLCVLAPLRLRVENLATPMQPRLCHTAGFHVANLAK